MMIGAGIMIGVVSLGLKGAGKLPLEHLTVTAGRAGPAAQHAEPGAIQNLSLPRFAILVLGFGSLGWLFEAAVTASVIRFAARVKPDLVGLAPRYESV